MLSLYYESGELIEFCFESGCSICGVPSGKCKVSLEADFLVMVFKVNGEKRLKTTTNHQDW